MARSRKDGMARWARWAIVGANGACTALTLVSLVPAALIYPYAAELLAAADARSSLWAIAHDALLCFGPLTVPFFLVLGATALRSALLHEPAALKLNGSALAAWFGTFTAGFLLVTVG